MQGLKAGRPSKDKAALNIDDVTENKVRLSLDISKELHKAIRLRALKDDIKIKDLIKNVLQKEFI